MGTEYGNDLKPDETYGGPAIGFEHKLEASITSLFGLKGKVPKVEEVLRHNQTLLNETGPKRNFVNRHDRKRRLRKKII